MPASDIYDLHQKAFARVSAYVVTDARTGECVAKIAFKFPADGAGRLYAYVHWLGLPMVRGFAGGYGYDKRSAAVADASDKAIKTIKLPPEDVDMRHATFFRELATDGGEQWDSRLHRCEFRVIQAV